MARVRPGGAQRWRVNAGSATEAYKTGVGTPRRAWDVGAKEAENAWKDGVADAAASGRYGKGVTKAGNAKWADRALSVGASRFAQGVNATEAQYESAVAPYLQVISNITLPPRYKKGDPRNLERVKIITEALRKKKLG